MNKKISLIIKALVIGALLFSMSGCVITFVYDITVRVTNYSDTTVAVYYREYGSSSWGDYEVVVSANDSVTFDLPSPDEYDFWIESFLDFGGTINEILYDRSCTLDIGSIDYDISINSDKTVDFY